MGKPVEVVAALIHRKEDQEEKIMICRRPANKARGLLWEFVGGKVEQGESHEEALVRECREELGVTVTVLGHYMDVTHEYPDLTVQLSLYNAALTEGEPQLLEHTELCWISPMETPNYDFCPADEDILKKIRFDYAVQHIPKGVWRHFKGNRYEVVGIAKHSETLEPVVVYRALYGEGGLWIRPAHMWLEQVTREGETFSRFTYEGESL